MKRVRKKTQVEIIKEWDRIARLRFKQIKEKVDISFNFILLPCVLKLASCGDFDKVIEIGCGIGFLTKILSKKSKIIVGVDPSLESIKIAKEICKNVPNVKFVNSTIENYARTFKKSQFTLGIANMSLMVIPNLKRALKAIYTLLKPNSYLVFTISHPCFWPFYWKYIFKKWFKYKKEIFIETPFKISLEKSKFLTTHIHRPLEFYINTLSEIGFLVDKISEPMPSGKVEREYPTKWVYPRFLGIRCIRK